MLVHYHCYGSVDNCLNRQHMKDSLLLAELSLVRVRGYSSTDAQISKY